MKLTFHSAVALLLILPRALAADVETIPYRAEIDGLWRGSLRSEVRAQSLTFALEKDPPATLRQLERRAENDRPVIEAVLKARGYLAAHVGIKVRTNAAPARVVFHIKTGPKYTISEFRVLYADMSTSPPSPPAFSSRPASSRAAAARSCSPLAASPWCVPSLAPASSAP